MAIMMAIAVIKALAGISAAKDNEIATNTQNKIATMQTAFNNETRAIQRREITKAGDLQAANIGKATSGLIGAQKVGYAGQGVDVDSETAQILKDQAREDAQADMETSRMNSAKKAWGLDVESSDATSRTRIENKARMNMADAANMSAGVSGLAGIITAGVGMSGGGSGATAITADSVTAAKGASIFDFTSSTQTATMIA